MGNIIRKWWVLALLTGIAAVVLLWSVVSFFLTPKAALTAALQDSITDLTCRFQNSPMQIIMKGYDTKGQNTVRLDMTSSDKLLGEVSYDMLLQADWKNNQFTASGTIATANQSLNLSAYLNKDFAALTSEELLEGGYYGITFETFSEDLRSIPLLTFFLPGETLHSWESYVSKLETWANRSFSAPEIPQISQEQWKMLTLGILALKCDISEADITLEDETLNCQKLTYSASGAQVADILTQVFNIPATNGGTVCASFYLFEKSLVKIEFDGAAEESEVSYRLSLGKDAQTDPLSLIAIKKQNGIAEQFSISLSARQTDGDKVQETVCIQDAPLTYVWSRTSGKTELFFPGKNQINLVLKEADNGFFITTSDFAQFLDLDSQKSYACTMNVSKGCNIAVPEYKNLDTWSFQDLLTLLSGIGSVLGISFNTMAQ